MKKKIESELQKSEQHKKRKLLFPTGDENLKEFQRITQKGGPDALNEIVKAAREMLLKNHPEITDSINEAISFKKKKMVIFII